MPCGICGREGHNRRTCSENQQNIGTQQLRGRLPTAKDIWQSRDNTDAYSNKNRADTKSPEIDHVFEIQLLQTAYDAYRNHPEVRRITRQEYSRVLEVANCLANTNITSMAINRSKKGPFTRAKNELVKNDFDSRSCHGVDYYVYTRNGSRRPNTYSGFSTMQWERIKIEVVASYDEISHGISSAIYEERNAEIMQDYLGEVFMALRID